MPSALLSSIVIECILSRTDDGLTGDGCVYDLSSSTSTLLLPEHLHPGDYVRLRLWLPDDSSCMFIELAEVQWVKNHRIKVDLLSASLDDHARLRQFLSVEEQSSPPSRRKTEQIVIRA